ncbi:TIGR04013 family B12-binding domain/radical SAM domain-containing protein [Kaarinaea lacus]
MNKSTNWALVFYYRKTGKYAMNVLAAVLDTDAAFQTIPAYFPKTHQQLVTTLKELSQQEQQILLLWSFYSPDFNKTRRELQGIKKLYPNDNIIHVAGGVHTTAEPLQTLQAGFDFVAVGEGEQIFQDIVSALLEDKNFSDTKGLAYLKDGVSIKNGKGAYIDLNDYPACAPRFRKFGPIEITRGCVYGCKFCQTPYINKAKFRHRNVDNVVRAVEAMTANGMKDFRFITPTSLSYGSFDESVNLDAIEELLSAVRNTVGEDGRIFFGSFPSELRPEHVTAEALSLLKRYVNNDNIIIGGQSGSDKVLESSGRGHNVDAIIHAVELSLSVGFIPNVDFLFGLPGETQDDVQATLTLAHRLSDMGAKIHNHTFMPLPGTPFRQQAPGHIDTLTQQQLVTLTSHGKAYGKWRQQMDIAKQLAGLRAPTKNSN